VTITETQISWAQTQAVNPTPLLCLACGAELTGALARLASNRCQDCRDEDRPIEPECYAAWRATLSPAELFDADYPDLGHEAYANDLDTEAVEYRQRLERRAA
jgi:hypothetical protein